MRERLSSLGSGPDIQWKEKDQAQSCLHVCWVWALVTSVMTDFATLWTVVHQAPLSIAFSRQEYWGGLLLPFPGDVPDPGIKPASLMSPALADRLFITRATWNV